MSEVSCTACQELREAAPDFVTNGVTETVCDSLANNTGLDASNGHDNATDLSLANDCLVGRMQDEVNSYGICDWKKFMKLFIRNVYEMFKAIICSLRGVWGEARDTEETVATLCEGTRQIMDIQLEKVHGVRDTAVFPTDGDFAMAANTVTVTYCEHETIADLVTMFVNIPGTVTNLSVGDVLFTVEESDLVPNLMHKSTFDGIMTYGLMKEIGVVANKWLICGMLHSHDDYPGKLVCNVFAVIGPTQVATGQIATVSTSPRIFVISDT